MNDTEPSALELESAVARFRVAISDWELSSGELAELLGLEGGGPVDHLLGGKLDVDAETRLRLATEVAHLMDMLWEPAASRSWLRDDEDDDVTPLKFMSAGVTELRAMRAALAGRLS